MVVPHRLKQFQQPQEQTRGQSHTSDERSLLGRLLGMIQPDEVDRELVIAADDVDVVRPHAAKLCWVDADVRFTFLRLGHRHMVAATSSAR
jgi:hypothetical protein